jgi:hypothetical protein
MNVMKPFLPSGFNTKQYSMSGPRENGMTQNRKIQKEQVPQR